MADNRLIKHAGLVFYTDRRLFLSFSAAGVRFGRRPPLAGDRWGMTTFYCSIDKVQTMADGSFRVYLGLPETAIVQASEMMAYHVHGTVLDVEMTPRAKGEWDLPKNNERDDG